MHCSTTQCRPLPATSITPSHLSLSYSPIAPLSPYSHTPLIVSNRICSLLPFNSPSHLPVFFCFPLSLPPSYPPSPSYSSYLQFGRGFIDPEISIWFPGGRVHSGIILQGQSHAIQVRHSINTHFITAVYPSKSSSILASSPLKLSSRNHHFQSILILFSSSFICALADFKIDFFAFFWQPSLYCIRPCLLFLM